MTRRPHRLKLGPHVLSFWTVQGVDLARNAAESELDGNAERARDLWAIARATSPADASTKAFCDSHSGVTA